ALPLIEQRPLLANLGVLLARHHLDIGPGLLLPGLLDREPPVEPFDAVRELLRAAVLEAVEDLFERPQRAALPVVRHNRLDLPEVVPLNVEDRKSTRLNSSHDQISYAVFC